MTQMVDRSLWHLAEVHHYQFDFRMRKLPIWFHVKCLLSASERIRDSKTAAEKKYDKAVSRHFILARGQ